jgi:hypothetical protein
VTNPHTAATEKIVADLAHVIGLPVPPVTLWDRGDGAADPRYVAVSAWAFVSPLTWAQAAPALSSQQKASLIETASAMIPFEMWIGADDRQNDTNLLIDGDMQGDTTRGAWIDYAFALDHTWKGNLVPVGGVPVMFPPVGAREPEPSSTIAKRITDVEDAAISRIVNRVPRHYLPDASAANIVRNLLERRAQVNAAIT